MYERNTASGTVAASALSVAAVDTRFGEGVAADLPDVLDDLDVEAPLVVTDEGVEASGVLDAALGAVEPAATYLSATEPSTEDVADLPTAVDGVVAVGGGSCIDTAKLAAARLAHGGDPTEYLGVDRVPGPVAPLVAVPTTSGTGSQATQTAVLTHQGVKRGVSDEHLRPDVAVVDPALTNDLPRSVTATSGFDAFVHALESLTARDYRWVADRPITYQGANPVSKSLSRTALSLVHGNLERAVFDGDDREARRALSLGSHLAGQAFSLAGLGAVHALASTYGGLVEASHGECLGASIRAGLRYNLPVRREQYGAVARDLGVGEDADALLAECNRLRASVGLPGSPADLGLDRSALGTVVDNTVAQERRIATNPREVTEDVGEVVAATFGDGDE